LIATPEITIGDEYSESIRSKERRLLMQQIQFNESSGSVYVKQEVFIAVTSESISSIRAAFNQVVDISSSAILRVMQ